MPPFIYRGSLRDTTPNVQIRTQEHFSNTEVKVVKLKQGCIFFISDPRGCIQVWDNPEGLCADGGGNGEIGCFGLVGILNPQGFT